jgi:hypothetical protein
MLGTLRSERKFSSMPGGVYKPPQTERLEILGVNAKAATATAPDPSRVSPGENSAEALAPIIAELRDSGAHTLQQLADALNERGLATTAGARWHKGSVGKLIDAMSA